MEKSQTIRDLIEDRLIQSLEGGEDPSRELIALYGLVLKVRGVVVPERPLLSVSELLLNAGIPESRRQELLAAQNGGDEDGEARKAQTEARERDEDQDGKGKARKAKGRS